MSNFCQANVFFKFIDCFQQSDILEKKKTLAALVLTIGLSNFPETFGPNLHGLLFLLCWGCLNFSSNISNFSESIFFINY